MTVDDTSNLIALTNRGKHRRVARRILGASCRDRADVKLSPSGHNCSPPIFRGASPNGIRVWPFSAEGSHSHQIGAAKLPVNKAFDGGRICRSGFDPTKSFRGWRGAGMRFQLRKIAKGSRFLSAIGWHAILTRPGRGVDLIGEKGVVIGRRDRVRFKSF